MFNSLWRRFQQWRSLINADSRRPQRRQRTLLRLEALEDRLTPTANFTGAFGTGVNAATFTITETGVNGSTANGNLTIINAGAGFQQFTFGPGANSLFDGGVSNFTNAVAEPIDKIVINLAGGTDNITLNGTGSNGGNGPIKLGGGLTITGTGGAKTIALDQVDLVGSSANLTMTLNGSGTDISTITDTNVGGAATITHGSGNTEFTINTSTQNLQELNTWNSLTITNGAGSDINTIQDTDFAGSVNINNGAGNDTNGQFGGSQTIFSALNNKGLLTVAGGLSIATTSGQSDTEVYDYNVGGTLNINAGSGASGLGDFVGISNKQTNSGTVMAIKTVTITGAAVANVNPGLNVLLGTGTSGGDFPLVIEDGLTIGATGSGSAGFTLNDLFVTGTTTLNLASSTKGDTVNILGDQVLSTYDNLTINGSAGGNNTYNLQTATGTVEVVGAANFNLGGGNDAVNVGSSSGAVTITGNLGVSSTAGNKTITVIGATSASDPQNAVLGGVNIALTGAGTETTSFVDTNVSGAATVSHLGTGDTTFTTNTSTNNVNELNLWNSLTIKNGSGSDTNTILDTDFTGAVNISNGAGHSGDAGQFGGSENLFHANNYKVALLNIGGDLTVSTASGQSDTEIYDYNVGGTTSITTGSGISGQQNANFVGLENKQVNAFVPTFSGAVTITGTTVSAVNPGLLIGIGTDTSGSDFPVNLGGNLTITVGGTGSSKVVLEDVTAPNGTTSITFGSSTSGNLLDVFNNNQSQILASVFNNFDVITSAGSALGANTYDFQDTAGVLDIGGMFSFKGSGAGTQVVDFAADSGNTSGVSNAVLDLWGLSTSSTNANTLTGGTGSNALYISANTTFDFFNPVTKQFVITGTL